jgi:hypothetical protein
MITPIIKMAKSSRKFSGPEGSGKFGFAVSIIVLDSIVDLT